MHAFIHKKNRCEDNYDIATNILMYVIQYIILYSKNEDIKH